MSADGTLHLSPLPEWKRVNQIAHPEARTLADADREHITQALRKTDWVIGGPDGAAALLGLRRTTLLYKMRRLGITRPAA